MHLTRETYESVYLDYLEGNLNPEDTQVFLAFLAEHPELVLTDEHLVSIPTPALALNQADKLLLQQLNSNTLPVNDETLERLILEDLEGQLEPNQVIKLTAYCNKYAYANDLKHLYRHTKVPPLSISYPNKRALKRFVLTPKHLWIPASAASLVFIIWLAGLNTPTRTIRVSNALRTEKRMAIPNKALVASSNHQEQHSLPRSGQAAQPHIRATALTAEIEAGEDISFEQEIPVTASEEMNSDQSVLPEIAQTAVSHNEIEEEKKDVVERKNNYRFQFFTKRVSSWLGKPVEIRSTPSDLTAGKTLYIRFGKFEYERKQG